MHRANEKKYNFLSQDDKLLVSKISDWIYLIEKDFCSRFSFFLDERQCSLVEIILKQMNFTNYLLYGGSEYASRKLLGIFAPYSAPSIDSFPIKAISFTYRKIDMLSHRDFLGSIMALQIKRDAVGDIIVNDGSTVVFIYDTVSKLVYETITKIGSVGVKLCYSNNLEIIPTAKFQEIVGTVASLRLDSVISLSTNQSREKAVSLIKTTGVDINYVNTTEITVLLKVGDVFSIRGYGKYVLSSLNGVSKKDRIHITVNKFI